MRRRGAQRLVVLALAWLASCSAATPKPEHAAVTPVASVAPPLERVRIEREDYSGKLLFLMRHGWREPADLRVEPMSLQTLVHVDIDAQGMFVSRRLSESSGNASFDQSVTEHLQALIDRGARAESGPPYIVDSVFGETLTVLFTGPPPPGTPPY